MGDSGAIAMLEEASSVLEPLLNQIAFVGGAVAALYVDATAAIPLRPTEDVDCVVEITSLDQYAELEEELRGLGLRQDHTSPCICRWQIGDLKIDVMPTSGLILGFIHQWYVQGLRLKEERVLPSGRSIFVFPIACFLATKFAALRDRGGSDWRTAHDLEDILLVIEGCVDLLSKVAVAPVTVRSFLGEQARRLIADLDFEELLISHLGWEGSSAIGRVKRLLLEVAQLR
ncbi:MULTISPECIES: hypothetical protein [Cyanophyceae]|uniref:Nucleotidyltransferase n=1 Tax=Leptolyngbya subtilissima DQ-A4 TaxID=2933933 RepID=A0ABV0KA77_9CYAN|nr:hypothetical protein [Nodosilinea sp. FACHB-141]MBD2115193.1 hypothetical protein [Nodosilinea sp. FACHB-141]